MKKIYFVRHGESEGNAGLIRLGHMGGLTKEGEKQSKIVAGRFKKISIDALVSSNWDRAKETTEIINKVLNKKIEFSDLFLERKRASFELGKAKDDPAVIEMNNLIRKNHGVSGWRYADEENFEDLKNRGLKALNFLENKKEENILVVTHGIFLRMLLACVVIGKEMTAKDYWRFAITFDTNNTGITVFEYGPVMQSKKENKWTVLVWNDYAHLG